jgi:hypothetical protein
MNCTTEITCFNTNPLIKFLSLLILFLLFFSCVPDEKKKNNELIFELKSMSDFGYSGKAIVSELENGELRIEIRLEGNKSNVPVFFPAHLHFGDYMEKESPMAAMLSPVSNIDLKSSTIISQLMDGKRFSWTDFLLFKGHIKVHLAPEGPDYKVILVAGNVGKEK